MTKKIEEEDSRIVRKRIAVKPKFADDDAGQPNEHADDNATDDHDESLMCETHRQHITRTHRNNCHPSIHPCISSCPRRVVESTSHTIHSHLPSGAVVRCCDSFSNSVNSHYRPFSDVVSFSALTLLVWSSGL